jgi:hypothetical protein
VQIGYLLVCEPKAMVSYCREQFSRIWHYFRGDSISPCDYKSLTSDVVSELEDVLDDQSTADNYTALKAIILERFTSTTEEKLRRLVSQEAMGDRTPSQFLRHLQCLSDKNAQDKLLRTLRVDKLPPQLQTVVAQHPDLAIADVAKIADSVHGVLKTQPPMCAATSRVNFKQGNNSKDFFNEFNCTFLSTKGLLNMLRILSLIIRLIEIDLNI